MAPLSSSAGKKTERTQPYQTSLIFVSVNLSFITILISGSHNSKYVFNLPSLL